MLIFADGKITDIAGSYEDYRQLVSKTAKTTISKEAKKLPDKQVITPKEEVKTKKLSYKHQRLVETIPLEIDKLELAIKNQELTLSNNNLYSSDVALFNQISQELVDNKKKLDELLAEWLELA